jgi:hypothetical protein
VLLHPLLPQQQSKMTTTTNLQEYLHLKRMLFTNPDEDYFELPLSNVENKKEWVRTFDVLLTVFSVSTLPRLGRKSPLARLSRDLLRQIIPYIYEPLKPEKVVEPVDLIMDTEDDEEDYYQCNVCFITSTESVCGECDRCQGCKDFHCFECTDEDELHQICDRCEECTDCENWGLCLQCGCCMDSGNYCCTCEDAE